MYGSSDRKLMADGMLTAKKSVRLDQATQVFARIDSADVQKKVPRQSVPRANFPGFLGFPRVGYKSFGNAVIDDFDLVFRQMYQRDEVFFRKSGDCENAIRPSRAGGHQKLEKKSFETAEKLWKTKPAYVVNCIDKAPPVAKRSKVLHMQHVQV